MHDYQGHKAAAMMHQTNDVYTFCGKALHYNKDLKRRHLTWLHNNAIKVTKTAKLCMFAQQLHQRSNKATEAS